MAATIPSSSSSSCSSSLTLTPSASVNRQEESYRVRAWKIVVLIFVVIFAMNALLAVDGYPTCPLERSFRTSPTRAPLDNLDECYELQGTYQDSCNPTGPGMRSTVAVEGVHRCFYKTMCSSSTGPALTLPTISVNDSHLLGPWMNQDGRLAPEETVER